MLKETLQGPSESYGSNYHHKESSIYQASNHWILTTLIVILFTDKNSDTMISTLLSSFCIRNIWIFFYSSGLPRKFPGPSNEWLFVVCFCHCCVSHLFCFSSAIWILRSEQSKQYILRRLQFKQTRAIFQCHMTLKACIRQVFFQWFNNTLHSIHSTASHNNILFSPVMYCFSAMRLSNE